MLTLSYLGSERVIKNYNIMGLAKASLEANVRYMSHSLGTGNIRVNAVSAGPIKTLAAAGISGFNEILKHVEDKSALRRNITLEEVANRKRTDGFCIASGDRWSGYPYLSMNRAETRKVVKEAKAIIKKYRHDKV